MAAQPAAAGRQYRGFMDAIARIGREEGFRGYYKGLGPSLVLVSRIAHHAPAAAAGQGMRLGPFPVCCVLRV